MVCEFGSCYIIQNTVRVSLKYFYYFNFFLMLKLFQISIYELAIPATHIVEKGKSLQMEIQIEPEISDITSYVK